MSRRVFQNGFTLLEVLVALAILAIAMAALVRGAGQNTANQSYLEERTFAHWVAMNRLAEVRLLDASPPAGTSSGVESLGGRDWRWTMNVQRTPDGGVLRVDVQVRRDGENNETPKAQLTGYAEAPF